MTSSLLHVLKRIGLKFAGSGFPAALRHVPKYVRPSPEPQFLSRLFLTHRLFHTLVNFNRPLRRIPDVRLPIFVAGVFSVFSEEDEQKSKQEKDEEQLILMIKRGILALQEGDFKKAEQLLHVALKSAQDIKSDDGITYIYDLLANMAYEQGNVKKAEDLFIEIIKRLMKKGMQKNDNAIVHISLKVANLYASKGDTEAAEEGYRFCLENQQKKLDEGIRDDDTVALYAMCMDWYARYLLQKSKYKEAHSYFLKAYNLSKELYGQKHEQTLVLLNDLGSVSSLNGDYDEALKYLNQAIEYAKETQTQDLPSFYINAGTVYLQKGQSREAGLSCQEGLVIARKLNNKEAQTEAQHCLESVKSIS